MVFLLINIKPVTKQLTGTIREFTTDQPFAGIHKSAPMVMAKLAADCVQEGLVRDYCG